MDAAPEGSGGQRPRSGRAALLLLLTLATCFVDDGLIPPPATADGGSGISATRRIQARAQRAMRRADRRIAAARRQRAESGERRKVLKRRLSRLRERRASLRERRSSASVRLRHARRKHRQDLVVRPDPRGRQLSSRPRSGRQVRQLRSKVRMLGRKLHKAERMTTRAQRERRRRSRSAGRYRARIRSAVERRRRAEGVLGSAIRSMAALARAKASQRSRLGPARTGFRRPARGHITQRYGCARGRRGSCRGFHDGIDIAAPMGTRVRASADGVVAYVGWNPWDRGERAFIVILGHAGGFESVYAHLRPVRKVRAGQVVRRGRIIGSMGSTGRSTGPHVHWEVWRGGSTVDPLRYR